MSGEVPEIEDAEKVMCAAKTPTTIKLEEGETFLWCVCGRSKSQPRCDGSHQGTKYRELLFEAPKTGSYTFCRCKSTKTPPLCDKSHLKLWPCCGGPKVKVGELYVKMT
mmetsp:Transcript_6721/g.15685  ORF Transcript_6721/g.15685 Transcript_6721/m.15685 type:complete len:109 (+) Transcript_6721:130-456(+)